MTIGRRSAQTSSAASQREATVVERSPDDGAGAADGAQRARGRSTDAMPADAMIVARGPARQAARRARRSGPPRRPSRSIAVTSNVVTPASARALSASTDGDAGIGALPSRDRPRGRRGRRARPRRAAEPWRATSRPANAGSREGGGPDDDARPHRRAARPRPPPRSGGRPATSTDSRVADRVDDRANDRRRAPAPRTGRRRDRRRAANGRRRRRSDVATADRIVGEGGLAIEVALLQSDDAAAAKVDRRQDRRTALVKSRVTVLAF